MRIDGAGLRVLTREECLALLATAEVGRIGVSTRALPRIFPVCFAMDDDQIVISTQHGTTLDASTRDGRMERAQHRHRPSRHRPHRPRPPSGTGVAVMVTQVAGPVRDDHD